MKLLPVRERTPLGKIRENKETKRRIKDANRALETIMREHTAEVSLADLGVRIYATVAVITHQPTRKQTNKQRANKPRRQINIKKG